MRWTTPNFHVAAATPPRLSTEYPSRSRGAAATRPRNIRAAKGPRQELKLGHEAQEPQNREAVQRVSRDVHRGPDPHDRRREEEHRDDEVEAVPQREPELVEGHDEQLGREQRHVADRKEHLDRGERLFAAGGQRVREIQVPEPPRA